MLPENDLLIETCFNVNFRINTIYNSAFVVFNN
jgi:hypothetical protein